MTNKEAIKYLIEPVATSTEPSKEYKKQKEAYDMAIEALDSWKGKKMDAIKEYMRIVDRLEHEEITLEEYEKLCEPLRNVVEVVRCEDCIHQRYCQQFIVHKGFTVERRDLKYCSYAERSEEWAT